MNNKRQTIWLVSMLSLMVILSAYYLFTGDPAPSSPPIADSTQASGQDAAASDEIVVSEVVDGADGDSGAADPTGSDPSAQAGGADAGTGAAPVEKPDPAGTASEDGKQGDDTAEAEEGSGEAKDEASAAADEGKTDEDILEEVAAAQAGSAAGKLDAYQLDRSTKNMKLYEDLLAKLNNQEATPEETAAVTEQMKTLEERESILLSIEEALQQNFQNAVVKEENNRYNVVVLSDSMDAKQAAGIVDLVMKELSVSQDKVSVQYVSP